MTEEQLNEYISNKLTNGKGFDPFTIIAIVSIIIQAFRLYQSCKSSKEFLKRNVERNGLASRMFFKKFVFDKLLEQGVSPEVAQEMVEDLKQEFLKSA